MKNGYVNLARNADYSQDLADRLNTELESVEKMVNSGGFTGCLQNPVRLTISSG